MSANASPRAQRRAILESPLAEFEAWLLAVDCGQDGCRRDRVYSLGELAGVYGRKVKVGEVLIRLRCRECGGRVIAATLKSSLAAQGRTRSLELLPG